MSNTNLSLTFKSEDELLDLEDNISLVLDSDRNSDLTEFSIGSDSFIKVFPASSISSQILSGIVSYDQYYANIGTVSRIASNIPETITNEDIIFDYSTEEYLDYKPHGAVSYSWIGNNCGNPVFNGRKITIPTASVGVLRCSYTTLFDRLRVNYNGALETNVLIVTIRGNVKDYISIPYVSTSVVGSTRDVTITVKNYCTNAIVPYASVTIWGIGYPARTVAANADGEITFEDLIIGNTYNVLVTASGYRDSNDDSLNNSSFTVE